MNIDPENRISSEESSLRRRNWWQGLYLLGGYGRMATIQVGDRVCLGNSYKAVSHFVGEVNKNNFKKTTRVDMVYIYISN